MKQIYSNPVLPGFYPDPSVIRVGSDYYMAASSFEYVPGLPIFHSKDLIHWQQIGHALTRKSQIDLSGRRSSEGIYAPTLRHHEGVFYIITTDVMGIGNFYMTAADPAGPWSDPIRIPYGNIDPSLMFDDDGTVYVTAQMGADKDSHIIQYEIDIATGAALSEPVVVARGDGGVWTEGPHLYKIKGRYYLICACGGTGRDHRVLVYRGDAPYGPFEMMPYPMLTHNRLADDPIQNVGHADLVEDSEGRWWAMFLGVRPVDGQYSVLGRETFLAPVQWTGDGWPVVDNNEGTVRLEMAAEGTFIPLPSLASAAEPYWRDDFTDAQLGYRWAFLLAPQEEQILLGTRPGYVMLTGNSLALRDTGPALFLGVRQQHRIVAVSTELHFVPENDGEEAGIAVRLNERGNLTLGIRRKGGAQLLIAMMTDQGQTTVLAEKPVPAKRVWLRVIAKEREYALLYSLDGEAWHETGAAPARALSPEGNGGFTGALLGMYATGNGRDSKTPAYFGYFSYQAD
ncbi:glycoside hydrolase family 43 protein [Paenibacillus sp. FSL W8-0186]|uniref:Glycoside hydrolase 43 family protein n=1 Tax=Paenibacillus woosongensis TaxID=307580 RepID=A0ABQ4MXK3_9BACL|nr:glycoside hydrolase family 43 protein [Paenibacillus woosongensis]GIP60653.1 glycoside hydrolase 43 family protein [Paenibacillus woosongensis]